MLQHIAKGTSIMFNNRSLIHTFLVAGLGFLLVACDGASTVSNPDFNSGDGSYTGPPAKTVDIRSFQLNFWQFLKEDNRCGTCHGNSQTPTFVNLTNVNAAYSEAIKYVDLSDPSSSEMVAKTATGHQCWLGQTGAAACADNIEQMISNWATDSNITSARLILLTAPPIKNPGDSKSFPPSAFTPGALNGSTFAGTVHPILVDNCQNCHQETATPLPIAPFFANDDPESSLQAAKPKMNIDNPDLSRFVVRLRQESHNCWTDCDSDSDEMEAAITAFANGIALTQIDQTLVTSKALNLTDGILAAGGNRHESNLVALWEFRQGGGNLAFDTSGIDPSVTLQINGSYVWLGGYGLDLANGYAFASNFDSVKLKTFIEATGEYAIEAWVVPANVTQENTNILGYSGGGPKNFSLGQDMYNYEFYNRFDDPTIPPDSDVLIGEPMYTTGASGEELLQSSLQHIVANYDPITGRSLYINGQLVEDLNAPGVSLEPNLVSTSIGNSWNNNFAFVIGGEIGGNPLNDWKGQIRLIAIHNRTLSAAQALQNFDVGVGEKFSMLFYIGDRIGIPESYILFEVSQFDQYSYLFATPTFINLDPNWSPVSIPIRGIRIGINGKEAVAGQAFANLDTTVDAGAYDQQFGQLLSPLGTIIALEKLATTDEFFLTFELLGTQTRVFVDPQPPAPATPVDPAAPVVSDIGVRTFEEISATISAITGIAVNNDQIIAPIPVTVKGTYDSYIQQLPSTEAIDAFLPSHQMAIAQLSLASCHILVETNPTYFPRGFDAGGLDVDIMDLDAQEAFGFPPLAAAGTSYVPAQSNGDPTTFQNANRAAVVEPLLTAAMNVDLVTPANDLDSQPVVGMIGDPDAVPSVSGVSTLLGSGETQNLDPAIVDPMATPPLTDDYESLITQMLGCTPVLPATTCAPLNTPARTKQIFKALCAVAVGSAAMLVQ
jgi:hypothetical protein